MRVETKQTSSAASGASIPELTSDVAQPNVD